MIGISVTHFRDYLAYETLKDGTKATLRGVRPEDGPDILEAFGKLDKESIYRRFFSPKKELSDAELKGLTDIDFKRVVALVVTTQTQHGDALIAGGRYAAEASDTPKSAELAFITDEAYRGRGIASLLLRHLALLAGQAGLSQLEADVLAENSSMLNVFRASGMELTQQREGNVIHVTLSLQPEA